MSTTTTLSPADAAYGDAVAPFNLLRVPAPASAAIARSVDEVIDAVRAGAAAGLRILPFSTGHAADRFGDLSEVLLVRTALDEPVRIDPERRVARVAAGTAWASVAEAAAVHGLVAPHGSAGTVGVVGYLLLGGIGSAARATGIGANSLTAVEYVDAAGAVRRTDADTDPDRFWALRGGGAAGIGVVTAIEVRLQPGDQVLTGARFWDAEDAADLLRVWRDWCADAPRSVTTSARVLRLPPMPGVPEPLTHGPVVAVDGLASAEGAGAAWDLLDALGAAASPVFDTWHTGPALDALATHMDPPDPAPAWLAADLIAGLPDAALDAFVDAATSDSPLLSHELRQLGGAVAEPEAAGGFLDRVAEPFLFNSVTIVPAAGVALAAEAHVRALRSALGDALTGRCIPTFLTGPDDDRAAVPDEDLRRLAAVRAEADPDGVFLR